MNINCTICSGLFTEWDQVMCDGCERHVHRLPCGEYELIERDGVVTAYFFCQECREIEEDVQ